MDRNVRLTVAILFAVMITVGVTFLFIVAPRLGAQTLDMMRDDVARELSTLRMLERNAKAFDGKYLPCGSRDAAAARLAADQTGTGDEPCWAKLGFKAQERAVYWVESDGSTFTAFARYDLDDDGEPGEMHLGEAGDAVADGY